jgi:hypothetical protein
MELLGFTDLPTLIKQRMFSSNIMLCNYQFSTIHLVAKIFNT